MFTYIYSILIKKDICDRQNVPVKFPCVCVCLLSRDLFFFWQEFPISCVDTFYSYFPCGSRCLLDFLGKVNVNGERVKKSHLYYINLSSDHVERKVPKYGSCKKKGKERENSYRKMKRSPHESHTQTYRNLIEIFWQSQMPFLIRRE